MKCYLWLIAALSSSIVGRPRHQGVMVGMGQKDSYVGCVSRFIAADYADVYILVMRLSPSVVSSR